LIDGTKFQPSALKGIFLGYATKSKGYKILNLDIQIVFINRDICFYGTIFPYKNKPLETTADLFQRTPIDPIVEEDSTPIQQNITSQNNGR